jgi:hypothetical protein
MGGRKEAAWRTAMGTATKNLERRRQVALSAGWAAGIAIMLVESEWGVDYVFSHLAANLSAIVGWLPIIATVARQFWG